MKHRVLLGILIALTAVTGCDREKGDKDKEKQSAPKKVPVETVKVQRTDLRETIVSTSTVDSRNAVDVVAEIPGAVVELEVEQGDVVKAKQRLARVSREELDLGVASAKSAVSRLEREVERLRPLYEKGILPRQQFDEAVYRLEEARAEQRRANVSASDKRVTAPTDGVIALRYVNLGQQVATGTPLFRIVQPDDLVVHVNLPESALGEVFEGQTAYLRSEAIGADREFASKVEQISPVVDPRTGTVRVTLDLAETTAERGAKLRPGMFVKAFIVTSERDGVLAIPRRAVARSDEGPFVFTVSGGTAVRRSVKLGVAEGTRVEVVEGVSEGDPIVVLGQDGLKDGTAVDEQPRAAVDPASDGS